MSADGSFQQQDSPGSRLRRGAAALGFGALAALGGSILYFAVVAITRHEFGIVAILVGFIVGKAVQKGSRGRGGWGYQALAVMLTYVAIIATYVPVVARELQNTRSRVAPRIAESQRPIEPPERSLGVSATSVPPRIDAGSGSQIEEDSAATFASTPRAGRPVRLDTPTLLLGMGELMLLAAVVPFAAELSNLVRLLIIGVALFAAWRLNRRLAHRIDTPYSLASVDGTSPAA